MDDLEEHERRIAFDKKYVLRSDYERDLKLARHDAMISTGTAFVFVVPTVGAILFWIAKSLGWL